MRKFLIIAGLIVALLLVNSSVLAKTFINEEDQRIQILEQANKLLATGDSYRLLEYLTLLGQPLSVGQYYGDLVKDLYWKQKDIGAVITVANQGITYCLTSASLTQDNETTRGLRSWAKTMAYNLGSFTWPGWPERGIELTDANISQGLEAARLNMRLAVELAKPADKVAAAHWLLGAQLLAAKQFNEAAGQFEKQVEQAALAKDELQRLSGLGFAGVARSLVGDPAGKKAIDEAAAELTAKHGEDGKYFIDQFVQALRIFETETKK